MATNSQSYSSKNLSHSEIHALADILANFMDWPTSTLVDETVSIMSGSFPNSDSKTIEYIVKEFLQLPSEVHTNSSFDHVCFIREKIAQ